jgi:hypothetical protein
MMPWDGNNKKNKRLQADFTLSLLKRWNSSEKAKKELWIELIKLPDPPAPRTTSSSSTARERRVNFLTGVGRFGDAVKALTSTGVAAASSENLAKLKAKFPRFRIKNPPASKYAPGLVATKDQVMVALKSFPFATGAGRDGLQVQHLLDALSVKSEQQRANLLSLMTGYVNALLNQAVPLCMAPFIASAPVIPLLKPNGGIRPIAVGEIWRRLTAKIAARHATGVVRPYLSPNQVGVGTPNGGEAIVHSVARLVSDYGNTSGVTLLKIDYENAFNSIDRLPFLMAVEKLCPQISRFVDWLYLESSYMYFGSQNFLCSTGVQQGDPLGPLLFLV